MRRGWCPLSRHVAGLRDRERTVVQWLVRHRMSLLEDASLEMPWVCEKRRPPWVWTVAYLAFSAWASFGSRDKVRETSSHK